MILLLVGLGNPGPKYERTRHNAGFLFLDRWAEACAREENGWSARLPGSLPSGSFAWKERFNGLVLEARDLSFGDVGAEMAVLFKPLSFMNRSGGPVKAVSAHYGIPPAQWLVLHDEIDLPYLDVRLKEGGGHRGHNGLRDILAHCGTGDFARIRIGVGRPDDDSVADYVLSPFGREEQSRFDEVSGMVNRLAGEWLQKKRSKSPS